MHHHPSIRVAPIANVESYLINIHDFQIFQPISIKDDGIQGIPLDASQSLPGMLKWLPLLSRCLFQCLLLLLLLLFSSPRAHLSFTFSCHQTFVLIMLKLLFLVFTFRSLIRSQMFRFLFSMAEGGCEKFPDHWNPEFFWTVIVEYLPWTSSRHSCQKVGYSQNFSFLFFLFFELNDLTFNTFHFSFSGSSYLMSPENWLWNLSCLPTQILLLHVGVPPVMDLFLGPVILPVSL